MITGARTLSFNQIINTKNWVLKENMGVNRGTRSNRVFKQSKMGKVYFLVKSYNKSIGELRSEVCASIIGRLFKFSVQRCWFCVTPQYKELGLPYKLGVLIQLDVRRQRYTKRNQFREVLVHGGDLISKINKEFRETPNEIDKRKVYTLDLVIKALKRYQADKKINDKIWHEFFQLLVFDALIGGTDRHYNNWGVLEKEEDSSFIKISPAFDNGISLLWKFDEYKRRLDSSLFSKKFLNNAESMFKKVSGGKYDLFELLEAVYSLDKYRDSNIAKKLLARFLKIRDNDILSSILRNIPQNKEFETQDEVLFKISEYVCFRKKILEIKLGELSEKYDKK